MLKLSKMADYAVVLLVSMGKDGEAVFPAGALAAITHIPEPTVAKILKTLSAAGVIQSTRGVRGGYRLDQPPSLISVAQIIEAIDGPVRITACVDGAEGRESCALEKSCSMAGRWDPVNRAITAALETITLADFARMQGRNNPEPITASRVQ